MTTTKKDWQALSVHMMRHINGEDGAADVGAIRESFRNLYRFEDTNLEPAKYPPMVQAMARRLAAVPPFALDPWTGALPYASLMHHVLVDLVEDKAGAIPQTSDHPLAYPFPKAELLLRWALYSIEHNEYDTDLVEVLYEYLEPFTDSTPAGSYYDGWDELSR